MVKEITVKELASLVEGKTVGDESIVLKSLSSLKDAGVGDISFLTNKKYTAKAQTSRASAIIAGEAFTEKPKDGQAFIF